MNCLIGLFPTTNGAVKRQNNTHENQHATTIVIRTYVRKNNVVTSQ